MADSNDAEKKGAAESASPAEPTASTTNEGAAAESSPTTTTEPVSSKATEEIAPAAVPVPDSPKPEKAPAADEVPSSPKAEKAAAATSDEISTDTAEANGEANGETNSKKESDVSEASTAKAVTADTAALVAKEPADGKLGEGKNGAVADIAEAEGQVKKIPYPKSVFFIITNEFCERFNYYGMRTILVLYLTRQLGYEEDSATIVFHVFTMLVYFLCIFGAIISDSWLGKFRTILYLSLVYVCGSILITLGAIPPLNLPMDVFTMLGLSLIALGSGGIKPCVSAFGGDQFKLPEQVKQVTSFFSLFYFAINSGSLISTTVTPILREDVHCFDQNECYSLAFGVPAILMIVSIIIFVLGRPLYKIKPPAGNMVVLVSKTIGNAISTRWKEKKTNPRDHWLDYADKKYDKQLINDVKVLIRVLVLYLPLPVFWSLFDQQGSRWTFQATRMNGDMGSWDIKPDQVQVINPLLILVFIPLYDVIFYPLLALIGIRRPLQKLTLGGILAGVAFVISGALELQLENTYPVVPTSHNAQFRVFNGESQCTYTFSTNIPGQGSFTVPGNGNFVYKDISMNSDSFELTINSITSTDPNCYNFGSNHVYTLKEEKAYSLFLGSKNTNERMVLYEDFAGKPTRGSPMVRTLANVESGRTIKWQKNDYVAHQEPAYTRNLTELSTGEYSLLVNDKEAYSTKLGTGGVYTFIIDEISTGSFRVAQVDVTEANSINMLWIIPQYVVMTLGEVMFSVTGLEFSYAQAPVSMKSVLQACWLLTVAFGNVIDVIVAAASFFESQASEFFLFAGLMFVDMIIFMWLAYMYKPNNPLIVDDSETEKLTDPKHEIQELEGTDNKAFIVDETKE